MTIKIITDQISKKELVSLAAETYKEMIKAVVDVKRKVLAVGGELHADAEACLLDDGSEKKDLWGVNLYPGKSDKVQYTSLINVRPAQSNTTLEVQDPALRDQILEIINQRVSWK